MRPRIYFPSEKRSRTARAASALVMVALSGGLIYLTLDRSPSPPPTSRSTPARTVGAPSTPQADAPIPQPAIEKSVGSDTVISQQPPAVPSRATREPQVRKPETAQRSTAQAEAVIAAAPSISPIPSVPRSAGNPPALLASNVLETPAAKLEPESREVRRVLERYRQVYNRLDARGARAIWPSVDAEALARIFARLERQTLSFDECSIAVSESTATAHCAGLLEYVPRVGTAKLRTERHSWTIELRRASESWEIVKVDAR